MKRIIILITCFMFCVPVISVQAHQAGDTTLVNSVQQMDSLVGIARKQLELQLKDYGDNHYIVKGQIDNEIMKTKIVWGITLKALCIIIGSVTIVLCMMVIGLYYFYSRLRKRIKAKDEENWQMEQSLRKVDKFAREGFTKTDSIAKTVENDISQMRMRIDEVRTDVDRMSSDVDKLKSDKGEIDNTQSEIVRDGSEDTIFSDILGYAEYLGNGQLRLFNSSTSETIYIIKRVEGKNENYFIVDSSNAEKAIKNKSICLDPLCIVVKGSQQSAIGIKTLKPGVVKLEQGNIYKVIEKADIELLS